MVDTYVNLPDSTLECATDLQNLLIGHATDDKQFDDVYKALRQRLMKTPGVRARLPKFVIDCRTLDQFWGHIKGHDPHWAPRREYIWREFVPLLNHLEDLDRRPADASIAEALSRFDADSVHVVWEKALDRRETDPEGAITAARTLLETVCKRILDEAAATYTDKEDLPKLYAKVAERLSLAPSQHSEEAFKAILGNCQAVVGGLGTLRNKVGDAHGRGGKPVRPLPRHAQLAVNLSGTVATFLVETWEARKGDEPNSE